MNPLLIAQGISAATGLIASAIPEKEITEIKRTNTEGSSDAGRVSGAIGAEQQTHLETRTETPGIKKALLGISGISGATSSLMSIAKPQISGNSLVGIKGEIGNLINNLFSKNNYIPGVNPMKEEPLIDDIPEDILGLAKTTVPQNPWKIHPEYNKNKGI